MVRVDRRDEKESTGSLMRRFNRAVSQAGILATARRLQFFEKSISKRERRRLAIKRRKRRAFNRSRHFSRRH